MKTWIIIGAILLVVSLVYEVAKVEELKDEIQELSTLVSQLETKNVMWENEVTRLTSNWYVVERGAKIAQELNRYDGLIELICKLTPPVRPLIKVVP